MHVAEVWHPEGGRVRCELCPWRCLIAEGHTGVCHVRRNTGGTLEALTYGVVSSIAADPIEKKPVFHYHPGSLVLSLGSVGCTMRCGHCQNWQISRAGPEDGTVREVFMAPESVVTAAFDHRCTGVAFTYNEPVIWAEYVRDCARLARDAGLFTVMVTNGYITSEGLDFLGPYIDVWRVDVKGATDRAYKTLCKVPSPEPVFAAAERAKTHWNMHVEVVTNVVPTINDSAEELRAIARWIVEALGPDTPWHITRFFPYLDFKHLDPTPIATLREARRIGQEEGLHYVFLGNIAEAGTEDTMCPSCGARAIAREGYAITDRATANGGCAACGHDLGVVE
ncbi:MAG: AmmeMemoRadiSam system radical SAM enzyme [Coriobacteriia bacterium]|nr:AmmeMemoRadiSam system radical SAM enzyme [Coriobacteriia bacterium]